MKKKNLKSLLLNKKSISNLSIETTVVGGVSGPHDSEQLPCQSIGHCTSRYDECHTQRPRTCQSIPGYCQSTNPLCPPTK